MLIIGEISYANVYPIFAILKNYKEYKFVSSFPSFLNKALRDSGVDTSPCSSIEYARNPENYYIIPGISISSIKEVKSVCLFSNSEIKYLKGKNIYLTAESGTSIVLLKILLKLFLNIDANYTVEEEKADAYLYIGDTALFKYYQNAYKYVYDLGRMWHDLTNLPFVFSLWLVTKKAVEEKYEEVIKFKQLLAEIKKDSKRNLSALIDKYVFKGLTSYQIIDYWEIIDYNLSSEHIEGLKTYYKFAYEIGEIKKVPEIRFI